MTTHNQYFVNHVLESCMVLGLSKFVSDKIRLQFIDHSWVSGRDPDPQVLELELCIVGRIMIDQWSMTTP